MKSEANLSPSIKNSKDFLQFMFKQMNQLEAGRIDINEAKGQSLLAKQVNNIFKAEFERANLMMKVHQFNEHSKGDKIEIRELEEHK